MSFVPSRNAINGDEIYYIIMHGLPYGYTWQDLKDLIRPAATRSVWTQIALYPSGRTSSRGYARFKRWDDAENVFRLLISDQVTLRLGVHFWDATVSPSQLKECNCPVIHYASTAEISEIERLRGDTSSSTRLSPTRLPSPTAQSVSAYSSAHSDLPEATLTQIQNLQIQQQHHLYDAQMQQPYRMQEPRRLPDTPHTLPPYTFSATGIPKNLSNGYARTESHGIFINGINFKARVKDIEREFSKFDRVIECKLPKDSDGRSKGHATVRYSSTDEAKRAIQRFDGQTWMDRTLTVRFDTERTTVEPPSKRGADPVIVNGSSSRSAR